jgi:hypothetical protein
MSTSNKRKCEKCGHRFDVSDGSDRWQCPKCLTKDFICDDTSDEPLPMISAHPEVLKTAHPRDIICNKAGMELWEFVNSWSERHGLTWVEKANILNMTLLLWCELGGNQELTEQIVKTRELFVEMGNAEREKAN